MYWRSTDDCLNNLAKFGPLPHWRLRRSVTNGQSLSHLTPSGTNISISQRGLYCKPHWSTTNLSNSEILTVNFYHDSGCAGCHETLSKCAYPKIIIVDFRKQWEIGLIWVIQQNVQWRSYKFAVTQGGCLRRSSDSPPFSGQARDELKASAGLSWAAPQSRHTYI